MSFLVTDIEDVEERICSRLEEMEDSTIVMKEFLVEKLASYDVRLEVLESNEVSEVGKLRDELSSVISTFSASAFTAELLTSTPKLDDQPVASTSYIGLEVPSPPAAWKIPQTVDEVADCQLRAALEPFQPLTLDIKERLTRAQLAYVLYWVASSNDCTGRRDDGRKLLKDGAEAGLWTLDFCPVGVADGRAYFCQKIKTLLRRQRRAAQRRQYDDDFAKVGDVIREANSSSLSTV